MKYFIKHSLNTSFRVVVADHLDTMKIRYRLNEFNEVEFEVPLTQEQVQRLNERLARYGIELIKDQHSMLVQRIKDIIREVVYAEEHERIVSISEHLSEQLHYSYGHLSSIFSQVTATSIAHYTIMQKVERVKELLVSTDMTLTEISYQLNYSTPAHLSNQFKKVTGLTPKHFREIMSEKHPDSKKE